MTPRHLDQADLPAEMAPDFIEAGGTDAGTPASPAVAHRSRCQARSVRNWCSSGSTGPVAPGRG